MNAGIDVLFAEVVSTPMIAYYSKHEKIIGVMVTASHNPYTDNGIKIFEKGLKSKQEDEELIEDYIEGKTYYSETFGTFYLSDDVEKKYLDLVESLKIPDGQIKVAYDSAHGANYLISRKLMSKHFKNSTQINNTPNGKNINVLSGSTHLETIKDFIKSNDFELGFAFDGDGDRVLLVDNKGVTYDGDILIYLLATYLKSQNSLPNNGVVLTKMSNPGILKALKAKNINFVLTDVGDKYVFEAMLKNNYILGGESSGHIILRNLLDSGDGLINSLYILKVLEETHLSLTDITKEISLYPFKMINIKNINKAVLETNNVIDYIENYKKTLEEDDLLLIRASGTEPLIRVTLSIKDNRKLETDINKLVKYIESEGMKL